MIQSEKTQNMIEEEDGLTERNKGAIIFFLVTQKEFSEINFNGF